MDILYSTSHVQIAAKMLLLFSTVVCLFGIPFFHRALVKDRLKNPNFLFADGLLLVGWGDLMTFFRSFRRSPGFLSVVYLLIKLSSMVQTFIIIAAIYSTQIHTKIQDDSGYIFSPTYLALQNASSLSFQYGQPETSYMYSGGRDDVFKTAKILAQTFLTWDPMVIPKVLSSQSTFTVKSTDPNVTFINTSITNSNLSSGQCYQVVNAVLILPSGMSPNAISLHTIVALNSTINSIVMADRAFNETMVLDSMLSSPNCKDGSTQYNAMMIKAAPPYKVTMAVASLNATLVKAWNETASNNTTSNSSSTMGQPLIKRAGGGPPPPPGSQPTPTSTQSGKVQSTSAGGQGNGGGGPPQSGSQTGTQPPPQSTGGGGGPPQTGTQTGTQPPPQVISGDAQNSGGNGTQNDINQQQQQQQQGPGNSGACTTFGQYKITYNITICSLSDPDIYKVLSTGTANDADYKADLLQSAGSMYQSLVYPDLSPNVVTPSPGIIQFLFSVLVFDLAGSGQKVTVSGIVAGTRIEIWILFLAAFLFMVGVTGVILGWWLDRKGKRQINNASSSIFGGEKDTSVAIASATTSNGFQDQHVPVSALEWAVYMAKTTSVSPLPSTPLSQQHPTGEVNVLNHQLTNKNSLMRPMAKVMKPTAGVIEMSSTDPTIEGLAGGEGQR